MNPSRHFRILPSGHSPGRALAAVLAAALTGQGGLPAHAELIQLSLYDKPAQSELVVRGRVRRGDLRLADVAVEEVLKGNYDRSELSVVFRLDNFTRKLWEDKVVFRSDEPVLLFLKPFEKESGGQPHAERFTLVRGTQGKVELPAEGAEAILEAVRRFIRVQAQTDIAQTGQDLRAFLSARNPLVVEAGLQQVHRLRLAEPRTVRALLPLTEHPVPDFRRGALRILAQVFEDQNRAGEVLAEEDHMVALVLSRAREDEDVEVRAEAVRTLEARGKRDVLAALEKIAREDPTQQVRFQAELAAYELTRSRPRADSSGPPPSR